MRQKRTEIGGTMGMQLQKSVRHWNWKLLKYRRYLLESMVYNGILGALGTKADSTSPSGWLKLGQNVFENRSYSPFVCSCSCGCWR